MPISSIEKKLETFTDTIISEAIEDAHAITLALRSRQAEIIEKAEKGIAEEAERYQRAAIAEIKAEQERKISAKLGENKFTLLEFRETCTQEIYEQVERKVIEFTDSPAYLGHLKSLLKTALATLGAAAEAEVYLRAKDMDFQIELVAAAPEARLRFFEDGFSLGGLLVVSPAKARRIDMSFDTALADMARHVSELAGLKMDQ